MDCIHLLLAGVTEEAPVLSHHNWRPSEFREKHLSQSDPQLSPAGCPQTEPALMGSAGRTLSPQPQAQVTAAENKHSRSCWPSSLPSLHNFNKVLLVGQHAELSDCLKDMFTLKYHISLKAKRGARGSVATYPHVTQPAVLCSEESFLHSPGCRTTATHKSD